MANGTQIGKVNQTMDNNASVLYVENNPRSGRLLARLLEDCEFDVVRSCEPMPALELCTTDAFGVVLVEYKLPLMTGGQLAERIKRLRPDLPVVMISGFASLPLSELMYVDAHFGSCTSFDDLLQRMRMLCRADSLPRASPRLTCSWADST